MQDILKEVGLSDREIAVYTALSKLGQTTTGSLVRASSVQNAKIYETLEKLMDKGLVSYILKGKIKHFQASDPKTLLNIYEEKRNTLQEAVKELTAQQQTKSIQEAKVYEGYKALKYLFHELYDYIGEQSEYYVFPMGEQLASDELKLFWAQVLHKQRSMKIRIKTLPNKKNKKIFEEHYKQYPFINIRYTQQTFPNGIFIFKDHVLSIIWTDKPKGFLIHSKENYEQWKNFFEEQWNKARS